MTPVCIDLHIKLISFLCLFPMNILALLMNIHKVCGTAAVMKQIDIYHLHLEGNSSKNYSYNQPSILVLTTGR